MKRRVWLLGGTVAHLRVGRWRGGEPHLPLPHPFLTCPAICQETWREDYAIFQAWSRLSVGPLITHLSRALAMSRKPRADVLFLSHRMVLWRGWAPVGVTSLWHTCYKSGTRPLLEPSLLSWGMKLTQTGFWKARAQGKHGALNGEDMCVYRVQ